MDFLVQGNKQLIGQLGMNVTYTKITRGAYDIDTGTVTESEVSSTIKGVQTQLRYSEKQSPDLIGQQACWLYILTQTFIPEENDKVTIDGTVFTVKSLMVQRGLQGAVAGYKLLLVKG